MFKPVTIDFETFAIEQRPHYPPAPVGVSIEIPGQQPKYYAWGHVNGGNNCTWGEAREALAHVWDHPAGLLFQNAKFDVDVAETHMDLPMPAWDKIHDTMYLLFLHDPHAPSLGLKQSAERLLGMPPEEQDAVRDWLIAHQPVEGVRVTPGRAGAYIAYAPGDLVGTYANGDVIRTTRLFNKLYPIIQQAGMQAAYDRERRLMPILLEMERTGIQLDMLSLVRDVDLYQTAMVKVDEYLTSRLGEINFDSGSQLSERLVELNLVDTALLPRTATGKLSTARTALDRAITDRDLMAVLAYRGALGTLLSTFMEPWMEQGRQTGGTLHTTWHSVKSSLGTRTGRLSSTPNFQNIPNPFRVEGLPIELPELPKARKYLVAGDGRILIDRDYSQQELRILAHFEAGAMLDAYQQDPWLDFHSRTQLELANNGHIFERKAVKTTNFGLIYGMGVGKLAESNGSTVEEAKALKDAILRLYPGLRDMYSEMRRRATRGLPIRTWGGRVYHCEPPKEISGRKVTFDYKMVNVLIQGSAADCSKEALIRYHDIKASDADILLSVHDQMTVAAPARRAVSEMNRLKKAMESVEFDLPILSEGKVGGNWADLETYDKQGEII